MRSCQHKEAQEILNGLDALIARCNPSPHVCSGLVSPLIHAKNKILAFMADHESERHATAVSQPKKNEQREFSRLVINQEGIVELNSGEQLPVLVKDMGSRGFGLHMASPLDIGTSVRIICSLTGIEETFPCVVECCNPEENGFHVGLWVTRCTLRKTRTFCKI
ncbi:MAG: hypothetical protein H7839_21375 [Magnetococcus sp. YQC-5]